MPAAGAKPDLGALAGRAGTPDVFRRLTLLQPLASMLERTLGALQVNLRDALGDIGQDDDAVVGNLDEPAEHDELLLAAALLDAKLTGIPQRDQRGVARQATERAFSTRRDDDPDAGILVDRALDGDELHAQCRHVMPPSDRDQPARTFLAEPAARWRAGAGSRTPASRRPRRPRRCCPCSGRRSPAGDRAGRRRSPRTSGKLPHSRRRTPTLLAPSR